jgi:hypothetical protein
MFNHNELLAIMKICDAGVRAGGIEIAEIAMPIVYKIRQSLLARPEPSHLRQVEPPA